jgi:pilus assembly protein TadC
MFVVWTRCKGPEIFARSPGLPSLESLLPMLKRELESEAEVSFLARRFVNALESEIDIVTAVRRLNTEEKEEEKQGKYRRLRVT